MRNLYEVGIKEYLYWLMLIFVFFLGFWLVYYLNTESFHCLANAGQYQIKSWEKSNNSTVICSCTSGTINFIMDNTGQHMQDAFEVNYSK
jgi:hypothetical protein